jgi:hypothetical protein
LLFHARDGEESADRVEEDGKQRRISQGGGETGRFRGNF